MKKIDIVILSNGPGELATWMRPVVKQLRQQANNHIDMRISVILSPCPHATGKETAIALSYPEVDRVQPPEYFWRFLLRGETAENWHWYSQGVVLFLGGDQFFTVAVGKRLGYRTVIYAEWDGRWWRWVDKFGAMTPEVVAKVSPKYAQKFTVVGDLMAEVRQEAVGVDNSPTELIGLLPGSKPTKLSLGVPLTLAIAQHIHKIRPQTKFIIPVAPTLDLSTLASFANPEKNLAIQKMGGVGAKLLLSLKSRGVGFEIINHPANMQLQKRGEIENAKLVTPGGVEVELITRTPAYDVLSQCRLCLTTVGANTAELASLTVPMIVLLPTQQMDIMRAWDGLPGLLANLPGVGAAFAAGINWLVLRKGQLFAWPNIWAKQEIVPELVGKLKPEQVAELVLEFLSHPEQLEEMRDRLRNVRGQPGAAEKLAEIVLSLCDAGENQQKFI
ncbi:MAG: lipid-A-disaccharide synthase [Microcoleaceae cyanobacterium MO_207.B10]|nr:lipid-A-disaccharide synthase [Microcoleaceae cyanobacterium MO_207.B10]